MIRSRDLCIHMEIYVSSCEAKAGIADTREGCDKACDACDADAADVSEYCNRGVYARYVCQCK